MEEKTFLKLAVITSILGIFILLFISQESELKLSRIADLNSAMVDNNVKIQGIVSSIRVSDSTTIMSISDISSSIKIVSFAKISLNKNDYIQVTGKIQEYQGNLEILASKIEKL